MLGVTNGGHSNSRTLAPFDYEIVNPVSCKWGCNCDDEGRVIYRLSVLLRNGMVCIGRIVSE